MPEGRDGLSNRIDQLESRLRFWRIVVLAFALVTLSFVVSRLSAATNRLEARTVVAEEFALSNGSGKILARLTRDPDDRESPGLVLMYPDGTPAVSLLVHKTDGPEISLFRPNGSTAIHMNTGPDSSSVLIFDKRRVPQISMQITDNGPQFKIWSRDVKTCVWYAPTNSKCQP
jgi:hypothetical protein